MPERLGMLLEHRDTIRRRFREPALSLTAAEAASLTGSPQKIDYPSKLQ
ncbi:hypothetical protein ABZV14_12125 [Streptosporangium canum]